MIKRYPFIKITAEKQPRLLITRKVKKDKGKYFGPYPNAQCGTMKQKNYLIVFIHFENAHTYAR